MALRQHDRELLALLCLVGPKVDDLDRMFALRRNWGESIDRLRYRGLVAMDSLRPSPSAIAAWEAQFRPANVPPIVIEAVPLTAPTAIKSSRHRQSRPEAVYSAERKAAFLSGVREAGTIQAGLQRAGLKKNSTYWWLKAKERDPAFGAEAEAIIAEYRAAAQRQREAERAATLERQRAERQALREAQRATRPVHPDKDGIDWELARRVQADRRRNRTLAERHSPKQLKDAGAAVYFASQELARTREEQARRADPIEQAKIRLQRRGRIVYRASVTGGREDRWYVSGLGKDVTAEQLLAEAERVAA